MYIKFLSTAIRAILDVRPGINDQIPPLFHDGEILIYPRTMSVLCSHKRVKIFKLFYQI